MDVGRVDIALDNVKDGDVASSFAGSGQNHAVLGLEETAHDI